MVISDIEGYLSPEIDSVKSICSTIRTCIIGETESYSDAYISAVINICTDKNVRLLNYHNSHIAKCRQLEKIEVPVVYICSLLSNMGKSTIGLRVTEMLKEKNYKPLFIASNKIMEMYGYTVFPYNIIETENPVFELNKFVSNQVAFTDSDIVVLCIPGGVIPSVQYNDFCDYGLLNYIIHQAVPPQYILNCIHQNTANISMIPEPFLPHTINSYIKTDKILDQQEYDFHIKNRQLTITKDMADNDENYNIFDPSVYHLITADIINVIEGNQKNG